MNVIVVLNDIFKFGSERAETILAGSEMGWLILGELSFLGQLRRNKSRELDDMGLSG